MEFDFATAVARFIHEAALLRIIRRQPLSVLRCSGEGTKPHREQKHHWTSLALTCLCALLASGYLLDISDGTPSTPLLSVLTWRDFLLKTEVGRVWSFGSVGWLLSPAW